MFFPNKKNKKITKQGFTLIEMLVAVFVFSTVMVIAVGAIFSIVSANKTSQALKSVLDNMSSSLDSMSRNIRYGKVYDSDNKCGGLNGCTSFSFRPKNCADSSCILTYSFIQNNVTKTGYIESCSFGVPSKDPSCQHLTADEVKINDLRFYVNGSSNTDTNNQPSVRIFLNGYAQNGTNKADFNIQTMVTQRSRVCEKDNQALSQLIPPGDPITCSP